jgi:hypothetical protein
MGVLLGSNVVELDDVAALAAALDRAITRHLGVIQLAFRRAQVLNMPLI